MTPIGAGKDLFWRNLTSGANGIGPVESFDTSAFPVHIGAEVKDFDPSGYIRGRSPEALGRGSQLAVAAARMALEDSGIDIAAVADRSRAGVSMGTTSGEPGMVERYNDARKAGGLESVPAEVLDQFRTDAESLGIARSLEALPDSTGAEFLTETTESFAMATAFVPN